jgi:hypothetical protein
MPAAVFTFSQSSIPSSADILGLWETLPEPEDASFSLPVTAGEDFTLWSVELPADDTQAENLLSAQRLLLQRTSLDLDRLPGRLDGFFEAGVQPGTSTSYALVEEPSPERELARWVLAARGQSSYALDDTLRQGYNEARGQAVAFLERVQRSLADFAIVETSRGGRLAGRTEVSWLGSFATVWARQDSARLALQHEQSLALALSTRSAWLSLGSLVIQAAVKLSALASVSPLVALPAAYKYLTEILEQYRRLS